MKYTIFNKSTLASLLGGLAFFALSATFASCDNVDEADRFIKVERPEIARKVLIQEFTGQGCINCPNGAALVKDLSSQYPGSIISVNMHPENTQYTRPLGRLLLTSTEATVYYNYFKPSMLPSALIDGSEPISNLALWTNAVMNALERPSAADLEVTTDYDKDTRELTVTYKAKFNQIYSGQLSINIWLTESNIVGPQYSGSNIIMDYVHNHVLRTSLTGEWGVLAGESFIPDDEITATFSVTLDPSWIAENCGVVAFLQDPSSKSVEQSAEAHVIVND